MTAQKHTPVSRDDAIAFLESACRNWSHVPALSEDDIGDVASELLRFAIKRSAAPEMLEALKEIASLGGNLPDSAIENVGGINEGRSRGIMYATARQIATAAIAKAEGRS